MSLTVRVRKMLFRNSMANSSYFVAQCAHYVRIFIADNLLRALKMPWCTV